MTAKKKVRVPTPIEARLKILDRCGIDRSRVNEPKVRKALDAYFEGMRKVLSEPIELECNFKNPPGSVGASRVATHTTTERIIHDKFVR